MNNLEGKIAEVYEFVRGFIDSYGVPPSVREICAGVGLKSPSSVHSYLTRLQELGYINKNAKKMRTITVSGERKSVKVPIIGRVTAGKPILAFEEEQGFVYYDAKPGAEYFGLRVTGNSMINAGILDGDIVVVRKQESAENGTIVVALIEDEATVKRLSLDGKKIMLMPENPDYAPIDGTDCRILGKVCALMRDM
ncbi:MAG: transcriptional repressor LexA [Clostridia bacterium]|nr:transcriptional repressor LexA [Clostridia bacterium]